MIQRALATLLCLVGVAAITLGVASATVWRADDVLVVKRLAIHPTGRRVTVQSDNPAYPDWPDCDVNAIHCIGRVIWAGRTIA